MHKKEFGLLSLPAGVLRLCAALAGKRAMVQRLCSTLTVDIGPTCAQLGWHPPLTLDQGLLRCAQASGKSADI